MKTKIMSVVLIICFTLMLMTGLIGCKKTEEEVADYSIAILTDIHVMSESQIEDPSSEEYIEYETRGEKILSLSEAVFRTSIDNIIDSDAKTLIISGDLTDDGGQASHNAVASELARAEQNGLDVFVIPGNHDLNNKARNYTSEGAEVADNVSADEFAAIFADYGYNEALSYYDDALLAENPTGVTNLSYTADIGQNYRLIAIDMCYYEINAIDNNNIPYVVGRHDPNMTVELLEWARAATEQAVEDGKIPLGTMHFPSMEHFGPLVAAMDLPTSKVNNPEGVNVAATLLDAGMKVMFTGHVHMQDVMTYENDGEIFYDIETAATANYPNPIRFFKKFGLEHRIITENIATLNTEYLPDYLVGPERNKVIEDFATYAHEYVNDAMKAKVLRKIELPMLVNIIKKLGFQGEDAEAETLAEDFYENVVLKFFDFPLYGSEDSVENIAKEYGVSIPISNYETTFDVVVAFITAIFNGDEYFTADSVEAILLEYILYSAFYLIADYDLFDKIYGQNTFDLMPSMEGLFAEGNLDVINNNMLSILINNIDIKAVKNYVPDVLKNSSSAILGLAAIALPKLTNFTFGIDCSQYLAIDYENDLGSINFSKIIEEVLFGEYTSGIFKDFGPSDNNLTIILN